ncbi:MAG: rhodanese-like domain-containing protein [Pseudomonadota bacterium]
MEQYLEFASNHLWLVAAFVAVSAALAWNLISHGRDKQTIGPQEATRLINREQAVVVDVRPVNDFKTGHIINAHNIPSNGLKDQLKVLQKYRNKPIIAVCRSGMTSATACKTLRKEGFSQVYNLQGGMQAWETANLPIRKT